MTIKQIAKAAVRYIAVGYIGFQLGTNVEFRQMQKEYAVIPLEIVDKYGSDFREKISDVVDKKERDLLEKIVFHQLKKNRAEYLRRNSQSSTGGRSSNTIDDGTVDDVVENTLGENEGN